MLEYLGGGFLAVALIARTSFDNGYVGRALEADFNFARNDLRRHNCCDQTTGLVFQEDSLVDSPSENKHLFTFQKLEAGPNRRNFRKR